MVFSSSGFATAGCGATDKSPERTGRGRDRLPLGCAVLSSRRTPERSRYVLQSSWGGRFVRKDPNTLNEQQDLQVTYLAVGDLRPFASNARTHPKRQVEQIAASISAFGFTNPILVDPDRNIIAGHG